MSVPNQATYKIVKPKTTIPPFVQINEDDWQTAFKTLAPSVFVVYLYLAQNANGYSFEYSPQAIANTGLMSKGAASKARVALIEAGYIEGDCFYVESREKRAMRKQVEDEIKRVAGR